MPGVNPNVTSSPPAVARGFAVFARGFVAVAELIAANRTCHPRRGSALFREKGNQLLEKRTS